MSDSKNRTVTRLLAMAVAVAAVCLALYGVSVKRSRLRSSIETLRNELSSLTVQKAKIDKRGRLANDTMRRVLSVVQMCRDADDIPAFGGNRVISQQTGQGDLFLHLPAGDHALLIKASWTVDASEGHAANESDSLIEPGSREWRVPLQSNAGYHFELKGYSFDIEPVSWNLSSNQPGFESQTETLNLPTFELGAGSSWGTIGTIEFPNEISLSDCRRILSGVETPRSPPVFRASKMGKVGDQKLSVMFEVAIETSGPSILPANQLSGFDRTLNQDSRMKYIGEGRYQIKRQSRVNED